ncbi:MAG TPA: zf-HC2 domain-containing protein [Bryobacteraceae bacterium]|nr:zf-HC2 domain-containing protein [Bryobacteraceae bacterium]
MNCSDIAKLNPLYLAGELAPAQSEVFSAHLAECASCRRELAEDANLDALVRASILAEPLDSSPVAARFRQRILDEQAWAAGRRARHRIFAAAGLAAALTMAVVGYRALAPAKLAPLYAAAARDHRMELIERQPRRWITDQNAIEALAGRMGLQGTVVTAFAPAGYRLAQARLCRLDGRIFLHLVYSSARGDFSLFLRRPNAVPAAGSATVHADHFATLEVAGFEHAKVSALIVSGEAGGAAQRLATSAAAVL